MDMLKFQALEWDRQSCFELCCHSNFFMLLYRGELRELNKEFRLNAKTIV